MKSEEIAGDLSGLERIIGYRFQDPRLLLRALTHSSRTQEPAGPDDVISNEQMEFLGDSILGFLVSEVLVRQFPAYSEGQLSKLKAHLVSAVHLHQTAGRLELGRFLRLGKGEERSGGRSKKALQVDALEALVAAIFMDGGIEQARVFVDSWILDELDGREIQTEDYKSELQELLQAWRAPQPRYIVVQERGPEHSKIFTVQLHIGQESVAEAEGGNKKAAQQAAAQIALSKLREKEIDIQRRKTI